MSVGSSGKSEPLLYPLRFEPIYQDRLWGCRRLAGLLTAPLPDGPIGEARVLSGREDHPSRVAHGPLKGRTIAQLLEQYPEQLVGKLAGRFRRFPLLLLPAATGQCTFGLCSSASVLEIKIPQ